MGNMRYIGLVYLFKEVVLRGDTEVIALSMRRNMYRIWGTHHLDSAIFNTKTICNALKRI